ncbi:sarcosine oxidase subunit gamma family protein [Actinomadura sp. NBRC 104412]|uniref:sarcosine oxidase subunit gamma n=1 Tax=Actinomadura sp. NBRC 104412 TaxID=3032203 RepID=UPI00255461B4|nr:sarcosine oxidase subunit gamma family protein [Actinomadura sp. NBRC 104412]
MTSAIAHLPAEPPAAFTDPASPVRLREIPFPAQVELRLDDGSPDASETSRFLVLRLPGAGHAAGDGEPYVLWLGPGWYLVVDREGGETELLAGLPDAVVVSAARTVLELSGPSARDVLSHDCPLDLHPRVFGPGRCAQTRLPGCR